MRKLLTAIAVAAIGLTAAASPGNVSPLHHRVPKTPEKLMSRSIERQTPWKKQVSSSSSTPGSFYSDDLTGLYKSYYQNFSSNANNTNEEASIEIIPGEKQNEVTIYGIYEGFPVKGIVNPNEKSIIIGEQQIGVSYSGNPLMLYVKKAPTPDTSTLDGFERVKSITLKEITFTNADGNAFSRLGSEETWYFSITEPDLLNSNSGYAFPANITLQAMDEYLASTQIQKQFRYDATEWQLAGTAEFDDTWINPFLTQKIPLRTLQCEVNKENHNLILIKDPYKGCIGEDMTEDGYILLDISDKDLIMVVPTVYSGLDFTKCGLAYYGRFYPSNEAAKLYYFQNYSNEEIKEDFYFSGKDASNMDDSGLITIKDYGFSISSNILDINKWYNINTNEPISSSGTIRLSQETLDYIGSSTEDPDNPDPVDPENPDPENPDDPIVDPDPEEGPFYYITGTNVNGKQWELADPDGRFIKTAEGIYEWTGTTLGTGFKINNGEWTETDNFGTGGDGIIIGEEFRYAEGLYSDNMYFLEGTMLDNPRVVLNTNNGTVLVTGNVSGSYEWYALGTFNEFEFSDKTRLNAVEGKPNTYRIENCPIKGEGTMRITTDGYALQYSSLYGDTFITDPTGTYTLDKVAIDGGYLAYILDGTYSITWNIKSHTLNLERTGDYSVSPDDPIVDPDPEEGPFYYITGTNVNGKQWELADPDGRFRKTAEGIYEWTGTTLGTGFKINNGEWTETDNFGTGGDGIIIGEEFRYAEGSYADNMYFLEGTMLENPKVVLNTNNGTVLVTGDVSGSYEWFALGAFNEFEFADKTKLNAVEGEPNKYRIENCPIKGEGTMRITTDGYALQYGSLYGDIHISDPTGTYYLEKVPVNLGDLTYYLDGTYTLTWDIRNLSLTMERTGNYPDPVEPEPTHATLTVRTVNGINYTLAVPLGTSMTIGHDLDEYWALKSLHFNGEDHTHLVVDNTYTTPEIDNDATMECEVEYAGQLDVINEDSGIYNLWETKLTISIENGQILIRGLETNDEVVVYNTAGMRIFNGHATADTMTLTLPTGQTYIVRVNDKAVKAVL